MSESGQFLDAKVTLVKWIFTLVSVTHTAEQRETICYKLLPMTGTGWICVSFNSFLNALASLALKLSVSESVSESVSDTFSDLQ